MPLRFLVVAAVIILLAAIATCSLAPSPNMREMWWIPGWLGEWADRNGNFRNFPVFAALAALLFFVLRFFQLNTANCRLTTSTPASTSNQPLVTRYGRWRIAFGAFAATALLGVLLEVAQLLLPNRHADPMDLLWMTLGAFVGAFSAGSVSMLLLSRIRVLRLTTAN
jgi:glycopeptide antibiotics resistance protein